MAGPVHRRKRKSGGGADGRGGAEEAVDVAAVGRIDLDVIRPAVGYAVAHPSHDAGLLIRGQVLPSEVAHCPFTLRGCEEIDLSDITGNPSPRPSPRRRGRP